MGRAAFEYTAIEEHSLIKLKHMVSGVVTAEFDLHEGDFSIGRNADNTLQLEDSVVSGRHCVISVSANEYLPNSWDVEIRDLSSTNGTFVNGAQIDRKSLQANDMIRVGSHDFKLIDDQRMEMTQTEYYVPDD